MFTRLRGRHPAGLIAIGVVITLVLSGTAMAVTDTSFTYSTVQTGYLMLGPGDLVPTDDSADYSLNGNTVTTTTHNTCFVAGVHVPQWARMTSVRTSYLGWEDPAIYVNVRRSNPTTGTANDLVDGMASGPVNTRTLVNHAVPANLALVNNALFTYSYTICLTNNSDFYGARITYQYTSAGD